MFVVRHWVQCEDDDLSRLVTPLVTPDGNLRGKFVLEGQVDVSPVTLVSEVEVKILDRVKDFTLV